MKLNVGCGPYPKDGFVNIDKNPLQNPDLVHDVRHGLPFEDGVADEVRCTHFLEHLWKDEVLDFVEEAYRVLKPDGVFFIGVPLGLTGELDHYTYFTEYSFDVLVREDGPTYFQRAFRWVEQERAVDNDGNRDVLTIILRAKK